jgi:hypothetical protein
LLLFFPSVQRGRLFFSSRVLQQGEKDGERLMVVLFQTAERERERERERAKRGWGYCSSLLSLLLPPSICLCSSFTSSIFKIPLFFSSRFFSFYTVSLPKFSLKSLPLKSSVHSSLSKKNPPLLSSSSPLYL